jgi:hypothetical protein
MNAPLRNALVMLPRQTDAPAAEVAAEEPDVCQLCGLVHLPEPVAALAPVRDDALPKAALDVLHVSATDWAPLAEDAGHSPMPLAVREKLGQLRGEFATLVRHGTGMPKDVRKKWPALREEFARLASKGRFVDVESQDWLSLPQRWRMGLLIMCGIDGDLPTLASQDFQKFTPPERAALKAEVRIAKRIFARMPGLASHW